METNKEYLARLLPLLKKPIPYQWRVQSYSDRKPIATVMAYIDVRDVQEVLDAYCDYGWHRKHQMLDGRLYCSIGIEMPNGTIQWREDCGTESNTEKEKGQASDSCKRSAVNWGIGRFLYDMDIQYVAASDVKGTGKYPHPVDEQGKRIYDLTTYINNKNPNAPKAPIAAPIVIDYKQKLKDAKDLTQLAAEWALIPKELQATYLADKDARKLELSPKA